MSVPQDYNSDINRTNYFKFVPVLLLFSVLLLSGRTDPGALLQDIAILRWLSYPIVFFTGVLWVLKFVRVPIIRFSGIEKILIGILLVLAISTFLNNDTVKNLITGSMVYLRYPVLFILLISNIDKTDDYYPFIRTLELTMFFLIIEAFFNYLVFGYYEDKTFITLGNAWGSAVAGIWLLYTYIIVLANNILQENDKKTIYLLTLTLFVVGALTIASVRSSLIYMPILALITLLIFKNKISPRLIPIFSGIIIVGTVGASLYVYYVLNGIVSLPHIINPQYRLNYIAGIIEELVYRGQLIFGTGARSMAPGGLDSGGKLFHFFISSHSRLIYGGTNQYVKAIPELGLLGFILYLLILYRMIYYNIFVWKILKYKSNQKIMDKTISLSYFPIWIHYSSIGLFNNDIWRFDISSLIFWTLSSYVFVLYFQLNKTCKSYVVNF